MYKQCDDKWRNEQLGTSPTNTICSAGCLMSSASMALSGSTANQYNPSTLNTWLKANGGYAQDDLFVWTAIEKLGVTFLGKKTKNQIISNLNSGNIVIINVHNGRHWVLATGYSGDNILVNDPGFSTPQYSMSEIVEGQCGVYKVGSNWEGLVWRLMDNLQIISREEADVGKLEVEAIVEQ